MPAAIALSSTGKAWTATATASATSTWAKPLTLL